MTSGCDHRRHAPARRARAAALALLALTLLAACRAGAATPTPAPTATRAATPAASPTRAAAATVGTPAPATPIATETTVEVVKPFTGSGIAPGFNRSETVVGNCTGPSLTTPRRTDAWRCVANGATEARDPCFALNDAPQPPLVCFRQPWSSSVAFFVLNAPLAGGRIASGEATGGFPWGFELADGTRCQIETESTTLIAGQRVSARCNGGVSTIGEIDRSQPLWTIQIVRDRNSPPERKPIARAWY